jgi:UDP-N-acetyl-D-glucosamine dehydrogenase
MSLTPFDALLTRIEGQSARVGIIGLGYVGLPLAVTIARHGYPVTGFDIDPAKMVRLEAGRSYIEAVADSDLAALAGAMRWTADFALLAEMDVIIICVPTPLTAHRDPDLSYVTATAEEIARHISPATLVVLESTTYPGTTAEVVAPILEGSGLRLGADVFLGFSPEREDPGNASYRTATIPKIVAGEGPQAGRLVEAFYGRVVEQIVPVSSSATAEAVKITENIFRSVNIALVNELKVIFDAMGIDVWEVIDAAATKPFGFMPFYPGPGLGGHCIPIDPFYLTWKAREFELPTRFIELAGEINQNMPNYVVSRLREVLDRQLGIGLSRARVLIVGVAYKKNVSDMRESPAMRLMALLRDAGATVAFHDPHVPEIPSMREYQQFLGKQSLPMAEIRTGDFDAVLIATDHDAMDYAALSGLGLPIIDTRNAMARRGLSMTNVTKA